MKQYLAHAVLHQGRVYRNSIVRIDDGEVIITPFNGEVQSTIFVPGLIAVCAENKLSDSDRRAMNYKVQGAPLVESAIRRLTRYLESARLYTHDDDKPLLVLLPRK